MGNFGNKYHVRYSQVQRCDVCAKTFVTNKPARFCSNACRQSWYRDEKKRKEEALKSQMSLPWDEEQS